MQLFEKPEAASKNLFKQFEEISIRITKLNQRKQRGSAIGIRAASPSLTHMRKLAAKFVSTALRHKSHAKMLPHVFSKSMDTPYANCTCLQMLS